MKLSPESCKNRNDVMRKWEGTVEGVERFSLRVEGVLVETTEWLRVNWGSHDGRPQPFIWTEKESDLVMV